MSLEDGDHTKVCDIGRNSLKVANWVANNSYCGEKNK